MRLKPRTVLELDAFELSAPAAVFRAMAPNGRRVSGERGAEGDERVRCMRVLGRSTLAPILSHLDFNDNAGL